MVSEEMQKDYENRLNEVKKQLIININKVMLNLNDINSHTILDELKMLDELKISISNAKNLKEIFLLFYKKNNN